MAAVAIRGTSYPIVLPKLRDPRLHLAATITSLQVLGQVAMATFKNTNGLEKVGDTGYRSTVNSGYAQVGQPGSAGMGGVVNGALEMSNVDLAQEFTNMISAQRGFQANSRVISTADQMLQDLVNLKR